MYLYHIIIFGCSFVGRKTANFTIESVVEFIMHYSTYLIICRLVRSAANISFISAICVVHLKGSLHFFTHRFLSMLQVWRAMKLLLGTHNRIALHFVSHCSHHIFCWITTPTGSYITSANSSVWKQSSSQYGLLTGHCFSTMSSLLAPGPFH